MKIYFGSDHAGFELKNKLVVFVRDELGYKVEDCGAHEFNPDDDYPDFIAPVAERVSTEPETTRGIVLGGSGQGEAMVANKFRGVRAVVYYGEPCAAAMSKKSISPEHSIITLSRTHNDANVLALGARFLDEATTLEAVKAWLETPFGGEERHTRRLLKMSMIGTENTPTAK
ncbi:MAG: RpiB/LacA/LacB family sugar-phosphate isomerase [bacterium]|nr:RpiB/LacA/LacB family sugar-phosphate isomerase [bacterium]